MSNIDLNRIKMLSGIINEDLNKLKSSQNEPDRLGSMKYINDLEPILENCGITEILKTAYDFYIKNGEHFSAEIVKKCFNIAIKSF